MTRRQPMFPVRRTELREEIPAGYRTLPGRHVHDGGSLLSDLTWRRCRCGEPVTEGRYGWRELNDADRTRIWLRAELLLPRRRRADRWRWYHWLLHPVQGWRNWLRNR